MANPYTAFPIKEFKSGTDTYLQPWIRPQDAFSPLVNAYCNRGTINKRAGYSQFGNQVADMNPITGIMRYIDEATDVTSLLVATTVNLYLYNPGSNVFGATLNGGFPFTGTISNFFNYTNWAASDEADSILYMANNKDPITLWDGSTATQPDFFIFADDSNKITTALDVKVYNNRLLAILPTYATGGSQNQTIAWSAVLDPTNFVNNIAGNGGFLIAPTSDVIQSAEFIRNDLIVFFSNSTWLFRFTGNAFEPFRWQQLNGSKNINAPYGSVNYDQRATAIGNTGLLACDGVNVQRYDIPIIDYYESNFDQQYYPQSFSQRYDNLNQSWTLYVSSSSNRTDFPLVGGVAPGSDMALIYNFVENTWATYSWSIPLTCLGLFNKPGSQTWESLSVSPENEWENMKQPWNFYAAQKDAIVLLAGDTTGNVWMMDDESMVTDNGTSIVPDIVSTRWNPIIDLGQKTQFGHIDIYYQIVSEDSSNPIQVDLNFYIDNADYGTAAPAVTKTLTLDGPENADYSFKRIYINLIGEFIQMEIDPSVDSFMQFVGFILWARPAGRLTGP